MFVNRLSTLTGETFIRRPRALPIAVKAVLGRQGSGSVLLTAAGLVAWEWKPRRADGWSVDMSETIRLSSALASVQFLDAAPDAMLVIDDRGRIEFVNRQAEQLFGYHRTALRGQTIEILVPERFRGTHVRHRSDFMTTPRFRPMGERTDLVARRCNGSEFPADISVSPVRIDGRLAVVLAVRDLTHRRRREEEQARLIQQLKASAARVRQLSGLLPICAWCRRVRDDEGYWNQLEAYIRDHTDADFSHGICPDCVARVDGQCPESDGPQC